MNSQKLTLSFFILSLFGFAIGYVLTNSVLFSICIHDDYSCRDLLNNIGDPLFYGMGALALIFLVLLFVSRAFSVWWKFGIWFIPLAALLFITWPEPSGMNLASPDPEQVFQLVSGFYVIVSVLLIAYAVLLKKQS